MAKLDSLPPALVETLQRFPSPGERNLWLFEVAARARHVASSDRVQAFLERVVTHQGWSDRDFTPEIRRAVRRAYNSSRSAENIPPERPAMAGALPKENYPPWPTVEEAVLQAVQSSPLLFDPNTSLELGSEEIIDGKQKRGHFVMFKIAWVDDLCHSL